MGTEDSLAEGSQAAEDSLAEGSQAEHIGSFPVASSAWDRPRLSEEPSVAAYTQQRLQ